MHRVGGQHFVGQSIPEVYIFLGNRKLFPTAPPSWQILEVPHEITFVYLFGCFIVFSVLFEEDVDGVWDYKNSVDQYTAAGGTARSSVETQISTLQQWLKSLKL